MSSAPILSRSVTAEAESTAITLTNIKATHAQIMAEIELEKVRLKAQITDQGRIATTTRMAQLGVIQSQVALEIAAAETAQSASSARLSAALIAQTAATSRLTLAKAALAAVFSPLGVAIAATAAAFYFLSGSAEEVKDSLATQAGSVESLTKKYLELNTVQALVEGVRLRKEIEAQNSAIDDAGNSAKRFAYLQKEMFKLSGNDYVDYKKAIDSIAVGADDAGELLKKMIVSGKYSQHQIDKLIEFSGTVAESRNKIKQNNDALKILNTTSGEHIKVTEDSIKKLNIETNLLKVATQNFNELKVGVINSAQAQVALSERNSASAESIKLMKVEIDKYSRGAISASQLAEMFSKNAKIDPSILQSLVDAAEKTDNAKKELGNLKITHEALFKEMRKTTKEQDDLNKKMSESEKAAKTAQDAYKKYLDGFNSSKHEAVFENALLTKWGDRYSKEYRKLMLDWAKRSA